MVVISEIMKKVNKANGRYTRNITKATVSKYLNDVKKDFDKQIADLVDVHRLNEEALAEELELQNKNIY